jgi:hypothetical protein
MAHALYLARTGQAFVPPVHPGNAPFHADNSTAAQIVETNRQFSSTNWPTIAFS